MAANPEHPGDPYPIPHIIAASAGFAGLVTWPAGACRRGSAVPWGLRPAVAATAVAVMFALVLWFGANLVLGAGQVGLAERVAGGAQAVWPLAVVLSCRRPVAALSEGREGQGGRRGAQDRAASSLPGRVVPHRYPGPAEQPDQQVTGEH